MKNITLSADDKLIEAARERARAEQTTLNEQFRGAGWQIMCDRSIKPSLQWH